MNEQSKNILNCTGYIEMFYQELPNAPLESADILILPFGHEDSVCSRVGTRNAPEAILEISEQIEYYDEDLEWSPMQYMKVRVLESISSYDEVKPLLSQLPLSEKKLLITLGGEHSITPMLTKRILKAPATIVFLDAHADLREQYQGNKYSHATPVHHLLEQGHKVIMAGIRSVYESEAQRIKSDENISCYLDRALQKTAVREAFLKQLQNLEGDVYFSVDMDAFNPAFVPSVGTPQPGGLSWYDAMDILEALFFNTKIRLKGVDLVELIPESSEVSQTFTAKLLQKIISHWGKAQGFDTKEMSGSQMQISYD